MDFDLSSDGVTERLSWTPAESTNAWLALDRNNNGIIDNGQELFGNFTPQPFPGAGEERNGFRALAEFDKEADGGNVDSLIDAADAIFGKLLLWRDANHNGISEPDELSSLAASDIVSVDLDYKESRRTDEHGNRFRYRTKVENSKRTTAIRWAWDVILLRAP